MMFRAPAKILAGALLMLSRCKRFCLVAMADQLVENPFGGQNIDDDEYEWFAAILFEEEGEFLCSGFLIGKSHVITANHCLEQDPGAKLIVEVGYLCRASYNCLRDHDFVPVKRWDHHEGGGDMAILTLEEQVSIDIRPAVPYLGPSFHPQQDYIEQTKKKKKGRRLQLVGAGRSGLRGQSFYVRKIEVRYLRRKACQRGVGDSSLLRNDVICSIPFNGSPCQGDSRSALVVAGKEQFAGRDVVMAVHSQGRENCEIVDPSKPVLHFRLEDAADLIQRVICYRKDVTPEDWCPIKLRSRVLHTMTGHSSSIAASGLSFNRNGSRLLSASTDGSNKVWDPVHGGAAVATFADLSGLRLWAARFHPHADYFASGSDENNIKLWKTEATRAPFAVFEGHTGAVDDVSWSPCGTKLASSSGDMTVKIWDVVTRELLATVTGHTNEVTSVSFHPDGTQLASASVDGTINLWDATTNSFPLVRTLTEHSDWVNSVSYSPDGKYLASASFDRTAKVWDVRTGKVQYEFREHTDRIWDVAWSPDGRLLATASNDRMVRVWDTWNGGRSLLTLRHEAVVGSVAWSPEGTLLASGFGRPAKIVVWRITRD